MAKYRQLTQREMGYDFFNVNEVLKVLNAGADVEQSEKGFRALHVAAFNGCTGLADCLLNNGADVNAGSTFDGSTPLLVCAAGGCPESMVRLLLRRGAEVDARNSDGVDALAHACLLGNRKAVLLLLDYGAAINGADNEGRTPLHNAAGKGYLHIVELLVRRGGDTEAKTKVTKTTPLQWAWQFEQCACEVALRPRTVLCLQAWSVKSARAFPRPFRRAVMTLLLIAARGVSGIHGQIAIPLACTITNASGQTRDVDILQHIILMSGLIDCDWFTRNPKKRLRTWLRPEQRLALKHFDVGDTVLLQGLVSKPLFNRCVAVVQKYIRKKNRFVCLVQDHMQAVTLSLRLANLEAPRCGSCGKCGAVLRCSRNRTVFYCGLACQKAAFTAS
tara:strand:+ start:530 stop:1696 length:1167 start_codon:yes stop_codon:yes gene_type:complete